MNLARHCLSLPSVAEVRKAILHNSTLFDLIALNCGLYARRLQLLKCNASGTRSHTSAAHLRQTSSHGSLTRPGPLQLQSNPALIPALRFNECTLPRITPGWPHHALSPPPWTAVAASAACQAQHRCFSAIGNQDSPHTNDAGPQAGQQPSAMPGVSAEAEGRDTSLPDGDADPTQEELEEFILKMQEYTETALKTAGEHAAKGEVEAAEALLREVAQEMENKLGIAHFFVYRLWDQLVHLLLQQGLADKAHTLCDKLVKQLLAEDNDDLAAAAAMFRLRRGAALFMMGDGTSSSLQMSEAIQKLTAFFDAEFPAIGEGRFYIALVRTRDATDPEDIKRLTESLMEALRHMLRDDTERGSLIRELAMSAHDMVIHEAFADGEGDPNRFEALYVQQSVLLEAADMKEKLAFHSYTLATILYISGDLVEAETAAAKSVKLCKELFGSGDQQLHLAMLRLATIMLDQQRMAEAAPLVEESATALKKALPESDFIAGEASFTLALLRFLQLLPYQIIERRRLLSDMASGIDVMKKAFGDDHPLCQKCAIILTAVEDASKAAGTNSVTQAS